MPTPSNPPVVFPPKGPSTGYSNKAARSDIPGTQGAQGHQGTAGTQGTQGTTGSAGTQGNQGVAGAQGHQGTAGTQGNQGVAGAQGPQGTTGSAGTQGNQGVAGAQGPQGTAGTQGTQGTTGSAGTQGNQGVAGAQGNQGAEGVGTQGAQGPQGASGGGGSGVNWSRLVNNVVSTSTPTAVLTASGTTLAAHRVSLFNMTGSAVSCALHTVPAATPYAVGTNRWFNIDLPARSTAEIIFKSGMVFSGTGDALYFSAGTNESVAALYVSGDAATTNQKLVEVRSIPASATAVYTNPGSGTKTSFLDGVLHNSNTAQETVKVYYGGTARENQIAEITLPASDTFFWDLYDDAIVLQNSEALYLSTDTADKVSAQFYGRTAVS